MVVIVGMFLYL